MSDIFTYIPAKGYTKSAQPRLKSIAFGDGYSQRAPHGINNVVNSWSLQFVNRPFSESEAIVGFLKAKGGWAHFLWTPPDESTEYKVICPTWSSNIVSPGHATIQATFNEVFDP